MTIARKNLGAWGEGVAARFLEQSGYRILEKNFRTPLGEIDIVARDGDTVCFVEVKTRKTQAQGSPFEAVSALKQRKLSRLALWYLKSKNLMDKKARFDIIAVVTKEAKVGKVEILRNAFDLSSPYSY